MLAKCKLSWQSCGDEQIWFSGETTIWIFLSLLILGEFFGASILSLKATSKPWRINHWISSLTQFIEEIESYGLEFHLIDVEIEFNGLNLAYQNRVYITRDVSFLNSFKNALTNEIVWKFVLFKKKIPNLPLEMISHVTMSLIEYVWIRCVAMQLVIYMYRIILGPTTT